MLRQVLGDRVEISRVSTAAPASCSEDAAIIGALREHIECRGGMSSNGFRLRIDGCDTNLAVLDYQGRGEFDALVCRHLDPCSPWLGDGPAAVINALAAALSSPRITSATCVEAAVLDALKARYQHLPRLLYERRFDLFRARLRSIEIKFEPIIRIAQKPWGVKIAGWEALAREPGASTAPGDLFAAAETWGRQFTIELDTTMAKTAIRQYLAGLAAQPDAESRRLSVNLYPGTLYNDVYAEAIAGVLEDTGFEASDLQLEISEKQSIDEQFAVRGARRLPSGHTPMSEFVQRMDELVQRLGVSFAVDDYGAGHATLDTLRKLSLFHVKVDRSVLHHDLGLQEIRHIVSTTRQLTGGHGTVVVEGIDDECPITLHDLYGAGVRYIQGYRFGWRASSSLAEISEPGRVTIADAVRGLRLAAG